MPRRATPAQYAGDEVIQFFRNSGRFKAGQRVKAGELVPQLGEVKPEHFAVYRAGEVRLAVGDTVRITANGRDVTGNHRIDNGRIDTIRGFTPGGDIVLSNGWVMARISAHVKHGLVQTSPATQSKTRGHRADGHEQGVAGGDRCRASPGHHLAGQRAGHGIHRPVAARNCLPAIARADNRMSATELFHKKPKASARALAAEQGMGVHGEGAPHLPADSAEGGKRCRNGQPATATVAGGRYGMGVHGEGSLHLPAVAAEGGTEPGFTQAKGDRI